MSLSNPASVQMVKNIIDGTTPPEQATKATQDSNGNNIAETYAQQSGSYQNLYVGRATQDGIGRNIAETYAKSISGTNGFEAGGGSGTGTETVSIGNGANANANYSIAIGSNTHAGLTSTGQGAIAIGNSADAPAQGSISIGQNSQASGSPAIAIGDTAKVAASGAIQIGTGTNSVGNTVQFRSYQLLDANGNIPVERLNGHYINVQAGSADLAFTSTQKPTNENDLTVATTNCLYPSTMLALNSQTSGTFQYRGGKTYTIRIYPQYANTEGSYFRISRVSNIVFVSGTISVKNAKNTTTNYIIYTGLPANANGEESVMAPFVSNNSLEGIVKVNANGQLMFKLEKSGQSESSGRIIFGFAYATNEN